MLLNELIWLFMAAVTCVICIRDIQTKIPIASIAAFLYLPGMSQTLWSRWNPPLYFLTVLNKIILSSISPFLVRKFGMGTLSSAKSLLKASCNLVHSKLLLGCVRRAGTPDRPVLFPGLDVDSNEQTRWMYFKRCAVGESAVCLQYLGHHSSSTWVQTVSQSTVFSCLTILFERTLNALAHVAWSRLWNRVYSLIVSPELDALSLGRAVCVTES